MKSRELQVIPKFMAGWIEGYREHYKNDFMSIGYDLYDRGIHPAVEDWIIQNQEKFMRAWFDGFTVEEEQKYVIPIDENHALCKFTNVVWGIYKENTDKLYLEDYFKFTEQEIKDYDERFWAFAVPVEATELF